MWRTASLRYLIVLAFHCCLFPITAIAQYAYTPGSSTSNLWSSSSNWNGGTVGVSGINTAITIQNPINDREYAVQDIANPFVMNSLIFARETNGSQTYFFLSGNALDFRASTSGVLPSIIHDSVAGRQIINALNFTDTVTVDGIGGYPLTFAGTISGSGGLVKKGNFELILLNTTSYTGLTTISGGQLTFSNTAMPVNNIVNNSILELASNNTVYGSTISGTGKVNIGLNAFVTFTNANTYSGGTVVKTGGTLQIGSDAALGPQSGALLLDSGRLQASSSFMMTRDVSYGSNGCSFGMTGKEVFLELAGKIIGSGNGSNSLTKWTNGTLIVSGNANPFSGTLYAREGVIKVTNPGAIQNATINIASTGVIAVGYAPDATFLSKIYRGSNGVLALTADTGVGIALPSPDLFLGAWGGSVTYSGSLLPGSSFYQLGGGASSSDAGSIGTLTFASNITNGSLIIGTGEALNGYGIVNLTGSNTFTGQILINNFAILQIDSGNRLGTSNSLLSLNGGALQSLASLTMAQSISLESSSSIDTGSYGVTSTGAVTAVPNTTLTKTGSGTLTFSNSSNAVPTFNILGGTLQFTAIPTTAPAINLADSTRLDLTGITGTFSASSLRGTGTVDTNTGTILRHTRSTGSDTYSGTITGSGSLNKAGAGTLILNGSNDYSGGTIINSGTLLVNRQTGTNSGTGSSSVVVNAGSTLGGTGQALGPITLRGSIQGGDGLTSSATELPILKTGALTFENASRIRVAVGGVTPLAVENSQVSTGAAAFNSSDASNKMTIELLNTGTLNLSGTQTYTVTVATYGATNTVPANYLVTGSNFAFSGTPLVTVNSTSLLVTFNPVPEPSFVFLSCMAIILFTVVYPRNGQ